MKAYVGGSNTYTMEQFYNDVGDLRTKLDCIRDSLRIEADKTDLPFGDQDDLGVEGGFFMQRHLAKRTNALMIEFAKEIMGRAVRSTGEVPPCDLAAVGIGSLGRGEATPYSDVEYLFLIRDPSHRKYFEQLAVMSYFLIGTLKETKIGSIDISELSDWFIDGRRKGFQIDGITRSSGNVPTGNEQNPNMFIVSPGELADIYKHVLHNPCNESKRGDLTAMLAFMCLIYDHGQEGGSLLTEFLHQKRQVGIPQQRIRANLDMLEQDLSKYRFKPAYDEYTNRFSMDMKEHIYRFPSLLALDLALIVNQFGCDSWVTLQILKWMPLQAMLALVCATRLRCHLFSGTGKSSFEVISGQESHKDIAVSGQSQKLIFPKEKIWQVTDEEFLNIS